MHPSIQAADALAWSAYAAGDVAAAVAAIEQALRTGSKDPLMAFHAGMIYARAGQHARAQEYLAASVDRPALLAPRHVAAATDALREARATAP
jgi:hypothetical protein